MKNKHTIRYSKLVRFIILFGLFEISSSLFLEYFLGKSGFSATPYIRVSLLAFIGFYFIHDILNLKIPKVINLTVTHSELLVIFWVIISFIELIRGLLLKNPILYIAADFIYILTGALLFYIFKNKNHFYFNEKSFNFFVTNIFFFSIGCLFFNIQFPSYLLILQLIIIYLFYRMGKYFQGILLAVPYFLNLNSSNRTMLGILLFLILIEILRILKKKYSISSISFFALLFLILVFLFKEELLDLLLLLFDKNSTIGMRIFQLKIASLEGLDYSNPFFTSITQRIIEAETVYYYWTNNIITFIFGSGLGGVIDGRKVFIDESVLNSALLGAKNIHNIHILPFALIFRYGIFGVLLFFQIIRLFYKSIKYILVTNLQENNVYFIFWNIFVFLWILFSIPASSFLWTMPIFWISLTYSNKTQSYINE